MSPNEGDTPQAALNIIVDSYEECLAKGISPETVGSAALSSALGLLVQIHGEDLVAKMVEDIPAKVRAGQFTHEK
jgi:hypothetical protein